MIKRILSRLIRWIIALSVSLPLALLSARGLSILFPSALGLMMKKIAALYEFFWPVTSRTPYTWPWPLMTYSLLLLGVPYVLIALTLLRLMGIQRGGWRCSACRHLPHCEACGYALVPMGPRCPECGEPTSQPARTASAMTSTTMHPEKPSNVEPVPRSDRSDL